MSDTCEQCGDPTGLLSGLSAESQVSLLRSLVDTSLEAIIVHEPDGTVVFYSQGLCRMLGRSPTQMDELIPFGWVSEESRSGAPERLEAILHGGCLSFRSTILRHDGVTVPTEVSARRLDTEGGPLIVATITDMSDQVDAEVRLHHIAHEDALTGLPSRAAFKERLELAIADVRRYQDLLVLAYIDLDHFKPLNDRYGHAAGDEVLAEVAARIHSCVRTQDMVARLGGDEFIVLLARLASLDEVDAIAERLLACIRQPLFVAGVPEHIDASIGFAVFDAQKDDERSIVVKADVAMYAAKADERRDWLLYDPSMS